MKKVKTGDNSDRSPPSGDQPGQPTNKAETNGVTGRLK